jgi:excisionase family DNA binding protein
MLRQRVLISKDNELQLKLENRNEGPQVSKRKTSPRCKTYSVPQAAEVLGIGRNQAYEAIRRGEIPAVRIGNRLLVPRLALEQRLAGA